MEKKHNVYLKFSLIFLLFLLVGLLPSEIKTGHPFGFGLFTDAFKQHLLFMRDYVASIKALLGGEPFSAYRYYIGLGGDFFLSYGYYSLFDPLTLIAYLIPLKHIELSYYLIAVLRLYLSGIFFILLAKELGIRNERALLVAAVFYCFNITVLYSAFRHPFFTNGPLWFPLIILGTERHLKNRSPFLLIFGSFLALITQFYIYIYTSFGFVLYLLLRLFPNIKKESFGSFLKGFFLACSLYALGAFLGGFTLVPQFLGTISSGRIASKGFELYNAYDILSYLLSFFAPVVAGRYTSTLGNFYIFFIILVCSFSRRDVFKTCFWILAGLLFLPFFGYAINAFSYINNRWTYLLILPAALLLGRFVQDGWEEGSLNKAAKVFLLLLSSLVVFAFLAWAERTGKLWLALFATLFVGGEVLAFRWVRERNLRINLERWLRPDFFIRFTLITSFLLVLGFGFACAFVLTTSAGLEAYEEEAFSKISRDSGFYRVDQNLFALNSDYLGNDNIAYGFSAVYSYNTMNNGYINDVIDFFNVTNHNNTVGYNGFDDRSILNAVNHVKYLVVRESEKAVIPYGFRLFGSTELQKFSDEINDYTGTGFLEYDGKKKVYEKAFIYENERFLDFGFVYHQYVNREDLESLSPVARENALLYAAVLDGECGLPRFEPMEAESLEPEIRTSGNITVSDGKIIVGSGGGSLSFSVETADTEVFVEILGLKPANPNRGFSVRYMTEEVVKEERYYSYGSFFYHENFDQLVNLGYYESGELEVVIGFEEGEYAFEALKCYLRKMEEVDARLSGLNSETLKDLEFTTDGFSGKINLAEAGLLFISLPYSSGFKAYVDGEERKIERVNIGYMGVFLEAGTHEVVFTYETPGMKEGLILSLASLGAIGIIGIFCIIRKKKGSFNHESIL